MVNSGFNPLQQISEDTGKSMSDLRKDMENGAVSAKMVAEAFKNATSEGGRFYGAMAAQSKTYEGQMSTLRDNFKITFGQVMEPVFKHITNNTLPNLILSLNNSDSGVRKLLDIFRDFTSYLVTDGIPMLEDLGNALFKIKEIAGMLADPFIAAARSIREVIELAENAQNVVRNAGIWVGSKISGEQANYYGMNDIEIYSRDKKPIKTNNIEDSTRREQRERVKWAKERASLTKYDWNKSFDFSKISNSTSDSAAKGLKSVKDTIADKMKSILNEVKSKAESIRDAFDIFSSPKMEKLSWKDLRYRMQKQLQMMEQWKAAMDKIGQRMGTESEIYRATLAQGPQAVGQAMALASMPDEFMNRFSDMYKQKQAIGMQFAAQQQAWQMKADNINQNITFNITEASDSDKIVQEVTKKFKLVGVM